MNEDNDPHENNLNDLAVENSNESQSCFFVDSGTSLSLFISSILFLGSFILILIGLIPPFFFTKTTAHKVPVIDGPFSLDLNYTHIYDNTALKINILGTRRSMDVQETLVNWSQNYYDPKSGITHSKSEFINQICLKFSNSDQSQPVQLKTLKIRKMYSLYYNGEELYESATQNWIFQADPNQLDFLIIQTEHSNPLSYVFKDIFDNAISVASVLFSIIWLLYFIALAFVHNFASVLEIYQYNMFSQFRSFLEIVILVVTQYNWNKAKSRKVPSETNRIRLFGIFLIFEYISFFIHTVLGCFNILRETILHTYVYDCLFSFYGVMIIVFLKVQATEVYSSIDEEEEFSNDLDISSNIE